MDIQITRLGSNCHRQPCTRILVKAEVSRSPAPRAVPICREYLLRLMMEEMIEGYEQALLRRKRASPRKRLSLKR